MKVRNRVIWNTASNTDNKRHLEKQDNEIKKRKLSREKDRRASKENKRKVLIMKNNDKENQSQSTK